MCHCWFSYSRMQTCWKWGINLNGALLTRKETLSRQREQSLHNRADVQEHQSSLVVDYFHSWKEVQTIPRYSASTTDRWLVVLVEISGTKVPSPCQAGTNVSVSRGQRIFSIAGDIITNQSSALTSEHADQLLFPKKNVHISGWIEMCPGLTSNNLVMLVKHWNVYFFLH